MLYAAALLLYAETWGFTSDEGFHLVTAQLIKNGKRPYLDFFFPQTPLNALWNAMWFRWFGDTWRTAHAVASMVLAGFAFLTTDFVWRRFPVRSWRFGAAILVFCMVALNEVIVQFGIAQAYALSLFLMMAGFRAVVVAVERKNPAWAFLAGLCACAAADATLLSAPASAVFFLWMVLFSQTGRRLMKAAAYVAGGVIAFIPLLVFFVQDPWVVKFQVLDYHAFHRQEKWSGAFIHDLDTYTAWLVSTHSLVMLFLPMIGLWWVLRKSHWPREQKAIFYLCGAMPVAQTLHLLMAHPTFSWYWMYALPFCAILGAAAVYGVSLKLSDEPRSAFWPVAIVAGVLVLGEAKSIFDQRDAFFWSADEAIAKKIDEVTPKGGALLATEHVYFLTKRQPPSGEEHPDAHKLHLSPAQEKRLHIYPTEELERRIKEGWFDVVEDCDDEEDKLSELGLTENYKQSEQIEECWVFWDKKPKGAATKSPQKPPK